MTLTLRARLAAISTIVFGLLLAALSVVSYKCWPGGSTPTSRSASPQLTDGLHGYLRFDGDTASVAFDASDNDQAAFVHEATRYYQVYDAGTGRLLIESSGFAPLGLQLTPGEVQAFRAEPRPFDIETDYGRLRISNSVRTAADGRRVSPAGGRVAGADGCGAGALSRPAVVAGAAGAAGRRVRRLVAVGVRAASPVAGGGGGAPDRREDARAAAAGSRRGR